MGRACQGRLSAQGEGDILSAFHVSLLNSETTKERKQRCCPRLTPRCKGTWVTDATQPHAQPRGGTETEASGTQAQEAVARSPAVATQRGRTSPSPTEHRQNSPPDRAKGELQPQGNLPSITLTPMATRSQLGSPEGPPNTHLHVRRPPSGV